MAVIGNLTRKAWADGYALGIMSTVECTFEGTMNCYQCKYSSEYNPEHKSQLVCKNNMVKQGMEIINLKFLIAEEGLSN
jgi:hypothetical protein